MSYHLNCLTTNELNELPEYFVKNKLLSQNISKKFKNRHRRIVPHQKSSSQKWNKFTHCVGSKKQLKRTKIHHQKYCKYSLKNRQKHQQITAIKQYTYHINDYKYKPILKYKVVKKMWLSQKSENCKKCGGHLYVNKYNPIKQNYTYNDLYNTLKKAEGFTDEIDDRLLSHDNRCGFMALKYCDLLQTEILYLQTMKNITCFDQKENEKIKNDNYFTSNIFPGNIYFERKKEYGFIVIDDIDINKQYYWNKKIFFNTSDNNLYYDAIYGDGTTRVIFQIGLAGGDKMFNVNDNYIQYWNLKAINARLPNQDCIDMKKANIIVSGYLCIYLKRMRNIFLPKDIQNLILWFYKQYYCQETHFMTSSYPCDYYCIKQHYIMCNREISSAHNVIMDKYGIPYEQNITQIFTVRVHKINMHHDFAIGIASDYNAVTKYYESRKYTSDFVNIFLGDFTCNGWWSDISVRSGDVIEMSIQFGTSSIWLLHLHKNGVLLKTKSNYIFTQIDIVYPYVVFQQKHMIALEFCGTNKNNVDILSTYKYDDADS
eukprot:193968_1